MTDVNYDVKTGRLTKDVEIKGINGRFLLQGCVAVNRFYRKGEDWLEDTSFFNFKQWFKSEKQLNYFKEKLKKGNYITIDGEIIQERWKDSEGKNQSTYVIYADKIIPSSNVIKNASDTAFDKNGFPEDIPYNG